MVVYSVSLVKNDSSVCVCVWDSQSKRKAGSGRIVVRKYKEGVYISYIVVRPNINTEMAK